MKIPIFDHVHAYPFSYIGLTGDFWMVHLDSLVFTWIAMVFLALIALVGNLLLKKNPENAFCYALERAVDFFSQLCIESFGHFRLDYFALVASLFFFTLGCNLVGALPFVEEPTKDLNTTLAVGLASFLYVQYQKVCIEGPWAYFKEFFQPIFLLLPLNIIDKFAKVVSMSFRLFGNILGGSIVFFLLLHVLSLYKYWFIVGSLITISGYWLVGKIADGRRFRALRAILRVGWISLFCLAGAQMFFVIFEGVIQAFVVAMLTITYLSVAFSEHQEAQEEI